MFHEDTPDPVAYAAQIAAALEEALQGVNKSAVAAEARIERSTLYKILEGRTWPDALSLSKLELALQTNLWPVAPPSIQRRRPT